MKEPSDRDDDDDDEKDEVGNVIAAAMLLMRPQWGISKNELWTPPLGEVCDWIEQLSAEEFFRLWTLARELKRQRPDTIH
jgi:hypothetical protein